MNKLIKMKQYVILALFLLNNIFHHQLQYYILQSISTTLLPSVDPLLSLTSSFNQYYRKKNHIPRVNNYIFCLAINLPQIVESLSFQ